jgi:hypothetical protein
MENVYQQKVRHQHRELKKHRGGVSKITPPPYIAAVLEKSAGGYFIFADPGEILIIKQFEVSVWKNGEK